MDIFPTLHRTYGYRGDEGTKEGILEQSHDWREEREQAHLYRWTVEWRGRAELLPVSVRRHGCSGKTALLSRVDERSVRVGCT